MAVKQYTLGDLRANSLELGRILQELFDLLQFFDGLIGTSYVSECRLRHVLGHHLRARLAEVHDSASAALHLAHEKEQQAKHKRHGEQRVEQTHQDTVMRHINVVAPLERAAINFALKKVLKLNALALDVLGANF